MAKPVVKQWYEVVTPKHFGKKVIGQSLSSKPENQIGRIVETSLVELTGEATKYYIKMFFKIDKLEGSRLFTKFHGHDTTKDFIARVVQLRTDRIDTNNIFNLKDAKIRVKAIAITNRNVKKGLEKEIRKAINELLKTELEKMTLDDFLKNMVTGSTQKKIKRAITKKYPLRQFEFRKSQIIN